MRPAGHGVKSAVSPDFFEALRLVLRDERRCRYAFLAVMALKALSYWIVFAVLHPAATLDDLLFFRRNDIEYLQLVAPFAQLDFASFSTFERPASGLLQVPLLQIAPYAAGYAVAGTAGIVAADLAIGMATFLLFSCLLAGAGIPLRLAKLAALTLLVAEITLTKYLKWHVGFGYEWFTLWDLRFPKPFVSFPVLLLALLWAGHQWRERRQLTAGMACAGGLMLAVLAQVDVFRAFPLHLAVAGAAAALLWGAFRAGTLAACLRFLGIFTLVYAVAMLPFIWQRLHEFADFSLRLGFVPVDRTSPPFLELRDIRLGVVPLVLFSIEWGFNLLRGRRSAVPLQESVVACGLACAFLSMPAMASLYGSVAQGFHFVDALHTYSSLLMVLMGLRWIAALASPPSAWRPLSAGALCLLAGYAIYVPVYDSARRQVQVQNYQPLLELPRYREDSIALRREIRGGLLAQAGVVGTFDPHVAFYAVYAGRHVYLPDAGLDIVPSEESMARLLGLCATLNLPEADVRRLLARADVHLYWGTVMTYNVDRFRRGFAPEEYPEGQRAALADDGLDFNVLLPDFAIEQWVRAYRGVLTAPGSEPRFRLDAIVLAKTDDTRNAAPDPRTWALVYENGSFRAWARRASPAAGA